MEEDLDILPIFINLVSTRDRKDVYNGNVGKGNYLALELRSLIGKLKKFESQGIMCNNCYAAAYRMVKSFHQLKKLEEQIFERKAKFINAIKLSQKLSSDSVIIDGPSQNETVMKLVDSLRTSLTTGKFTQRQMQTPALTKVLGGQKLGANAGFSAQRNLRSRGAVNNNDMISVGDIKLENPSSNFADPLIEEEHGSILMVNENGQQIGNEYFQLIGTNANDGSTGPASPVDNSLSSNSAEYYNINQNEDNDGCSDYGDINASTDSESEADNDTDFQPSASKKIKNAYSNRTSIKETENVEEVVNEDGVTRMFFKGFELKMLDNGACMCVTCAGKKIFSSLRGVKYHINENHLGML